ncbi:hypothetical protein GCM10022295_47510 [Streptomyces osmaniensis]|uniref:Uncharacterized protein n=1 Tax=Streptomyces osmaniensis TaxID=593134 RepID=A0ABP6X198_9ACTN
MAPTRPPPPNISATAAKVARRAPVGRLRVLRPKEVLLRLVVGQGMKIPRSYTEADGAVFNRLRNSQKYLMSRVNLV